MNEAAKEQLTTWLRSLPPTKGALVRSLRFPDETISSDVESRDFPATSLEQAWRSVADTFQVLSAQQFPAASLAWNFERTQLHCAMRPDGILFGMFISKKGAPSAAAEIQHLIAQFQSLQLPATDSPAA